MSARTEVAGYLTTNLPTDWRVYPYGRDLDGLSAPTVMVEQTTVSPGASAGLRTAGITITLAVPGQDPAKVEDALEVALDTLLDTLDGLPHVSLTAQRGVINNSTINAYSVTVEVPVRKEPS